MHARALGVLSLSTLNSPAQRTRESLLHKTKNNESTENLVDYAHDFDQWSTWANAILDPYLDPERA